MKRTHIYLEEEQRRRLDERARATGRTRSVLIRKAIDAYLGVADQVDSALQAFRRAVDDAAGIASHLPSGQEYVNAMRIADARREVELERRGRT